MTTMFAAKFPNFRQLDKMDCGPSSLKIISAYYGGNHDLNKLRELCGVGTTGVSIGGMLEASELIQMDAMAIAVTFDELKNDVPLPAIVHWNNNHFLVVYKIKSGKVYVSDPAIGLMSYSEVDFKKGWFGNSSKETGAAVILRPRSDFLDSSQYNEEKKTLSFLIEYFKPYKKLIYQVVIGLLLGVITQLSIPFLTQSMVDYGINFDNLSFIKIILAAQLILYLTQSGIEFVRSWIILHVTTRINIQIISDFILILMGMPIKFFESKNPGDFMQRISDHDRINNFLSSNSLIAIMGILNIVIFGAVLMYFNLGVFLIFLVGTGLYFGWHLMFMRRRAILDHLKFEEDSNNQAHIMQLIYGAEEIKFNASQNRRRSNWYNTQIKLFKISIKTLRLEQIQIKGGTVLNEVKNIFIVFVAANSVVTGNITLGTLLAIMFIIGSLNVPIKDLMNFILDYQDAKLSLKRLVEIHGYLENDENVSTIKVPKAKELVFKNVSFKYPSSGPNYILKDIDCTFNIGKTTAIVGSSGSGKTSLLRLLLRVYEPNMGGIYLDGTKIGNVNKAAWRKQCGSVLQKGFIFDDTLRNNITESGSLRRFDEERYNEAIEVSNLKELVESLPNGNDTVIHGAGSNLSGGERQRVLIARAVYKNPNFIFFDEATSSLDSKNESEIMEKLEHFYEKKTVIIIAHRLSTVRNADNIIVLNKGKIVETGTHIELLNKNGYYQELVAKQL